MGEHLASAARGRPWEGVRFATWGSRDVLDVVWVRPALVAEVGAEQLLVLGRYDQDGRLRAVGRATPLKPDAARRLADHLTAAGSDHPWTGVRFAAAWGSREPLDPILVVPELVAEVSADTAIDRGAWRHPPPRFVRPRLDVTVADVPGFGEGAQPSSG